MQASSLPTKFAVPFASGAGAGFTRSVPQASQQGITPGAASLVDGFPPLCFLPVGSGGIPPAGQDFNGILGQITAWNQWQGAGGTVPFDSTFSTAIGGYPAGAIVRSTTPGVLYLSTADNNTTNPDGASSAGWLRISTSQSVLQANGTYYVNAATGNDTNNGLTAGTAFATLQAAVNTIAKFNLNGFSVTVNVANGTYPNVVLAPVSGSGSVTFSGNSSNPTNCIIQSSAGRNAITAIGAGAAYVFSGFTLIASGSPASGDSVAGIVAVGSGTSVSIGNMNFGSCAGGHMIAAQNAIIYLGGSNLVTGGCTGSTNGAGAHMSANSFGNIFSTPGSLPTIAISNTPSFAAAWAYAFNLGYIQMLYGAGGVSGSVGSAQRYSATGNSVISTAGGGANYFPGTSAGTTASGGQYI